MTTTVAAIASAAFTAGAAAISGIFHTASLIYDLVGGLFKEDYGLIKTAISDPSEIEDYGSIADAVTETEDWGSLTDETYDYDPATGTYAPVAEITITGGQAFEDTGAVIKNRFPDYIAGPNDIVILLEGFTTVPEIGWRISYNGKIIEIKAVGDIAGAGEFFEVIAA